MSADVSVFIILKKKNYLFFYICLDNVFDNNGNVVDDGNGNSNDNDIDNDNENVYDYDNEDDYNGNKIVIMKIAPLTYQW